MAHKYLTTFDYLKELNYLQNQFIQLLINNNLCHTKRPTTKTTLEENL